MAFLDGRGDDHPIARDVHRRIREAVDRSELSLRWIVEGDNKTAVSQVIEQEGLLIREIGAQLVAVAYQLDELATRVRNLDSQLEMIRSLRGPTES